MCVCVGGGSAFDFKSRTILLLSAGGDVRVNGYKNEEEDDEGKGCATGRMPRRRGHWILADAFVRDDSEEVVECLN